MRRVLYNIIFSVCLGLLLAIAREVHAEAAATTRSSTISNSAVLKEWMQDSEFAAAWRLFEQGRVEAAHGAFHAMFMRDPAHIGVNFALGITARAAGRPSNAAMAFERILMSQPDNDRVRLELALTYYQMDQQDLARIYAEDVLQRDPPQSVRANVETLLSQIEKSRSRFKITSNASLGVLYDSNPNTGPDSDFVSIAPIVVGPVIFERLELGETSAPRESWGMLVSAYVSGIYEIGNPGGWRATGLAYFSQSYLENAHDYDTTVLRAMGGLQYMRGRSVTSLPLRYDRVLLRRNDFVQIFSAGFSHVCQTGLRIRWTSGAALEQREYLNARNRDNMRVSFNQGLRYVRQSNLHFSGGVSFFNEDAQNDIYTNYGLDPFVSATWKTDRSTSLSARMQYRRSWYDKREVLSPQDREDNQWQLRLDANRRLAKSYAVNLTYQFTDNDSTFDVYDYQRHLVNLNLSRRF